MNVSAKPILNTQVASKHNPFVKTSYSKKEVTDSNKCKEQGVVLELSEDSINEKVF